MVGSRVPDFEISKLPLGLFQLILNRFAIISETNQQYQSLQLSEFGKIDIRNCLFKMFWGISRGWNHLEPFNFKIGWTS